MDNFNLTVNISKLYEHVQQHIDTKTYTQNAKKKWPKPSQVLFSLGPTVHRNIIQHILLHIYFTIQTSPSYGVTRFSAALFVTMMKHDVRLFKKRITAAGCSRKRLTVKHAHDEYCNMLCTVGVVIAIWLRCLRIYTTLLLSTSHRRYVFL